MVPQHVKAYPDLLIAFYAADKSPLARFYQTMRAIDHGGRGWLDLGELRAMLTDKKSKWHICGRRYFRMLLAEGNGLAWNIEAGRVYYWCPDKILTSLGAGRLTSEPVLLPVKKTLLSGIKAFKAHTLAAWHAGRRENNPITRETIRQETTIPESTQRVYDTEAGVKHQCNIVIKGEKTKEAYQAAAWERGRGVFTFTDWLGRMGGKGKRYIAWQLPNSFEAQHKQTAKGRQRKINRRIDLVKEPERGNGDEVKRLYYQDGSAASGAYNRDCTHDHYFPIRKTLTRTATKKPKLMGVGLWDLLPGQA